MTLPDILILAAGSSARMGARDKLTEQVEGPPLLTRVCERALVTGAPVTVVLPPDRPSRNSAVAGLSLRIVTAQNAADGMAASLRAGLTALPAHSPGVMILPADMPDLTTADLRLLLKHFAQDPSRIWRGASADGQPGHPALFPAEFFTELARVQGDEGGRSVLKRHQTRVSTVRLPSNHAMLDLDTPEDWAAWRARQSGGQ